MKVPESWRDQMLTKCRTKSVLQNVQADLCVSEDNEGVFHARLISREPFVDAEDAWKVAREIVAADPDRFLCQGNPIASERFAEAVLFMDPEHWPRLLSSEDKQRMNRQGFDAGKPMQVLLESDGVRRAFCRLLVALLLQIGNPKPRMIAWVADSGAVPWKTSPWRGIVRALGIADLETKNWALVLVYNRNSIPKDDAGKDLYVPRAFDGMGHDKFLLQEDCNAAVGLTKPLDSAQPGTQGYPEAVHRSDRIDVDSVELGRIDNGSGTSGSLGSAT